MRRPLVAILTPVALVLLWPLGVVLLWLQGSWRVADKVVGTLVLPGGWFSAWFIATGVRTNCDPGLDAGCHPPLAYQITHPTPWWGFSHVFGPLVLIALVVLPLLAAAYLEAQLLRSERRIAATVVP